MITKTAFQTFGFIGLGLIGGSIARAIREKLPLSRILVFDADQYHGACLNKRCCI